MAYISQLVRQIRMAHLPMICRPFSTAGKATLMADVDPSPRRLQNLVSAVYRHGIVSAGENSGMSREEDQLKKAAAESAVAQVTGGMIVGLGSGSTAAFAVNALARRVREGLQIVGVPTSEHTAAQARELGIPLSTLSEQPNVNITIDGADEVEEGTLNLIKGHGGALLREKIVAISSE